MKFLLLLPLALPILSNPIPDIQVTSSDNTTTQSSGTTTLTTTTTNLTSIQSQSLSASTTSGINSLLAAVGKLPLVGLTVNALSGVITAAQATLAKTLRIDTTEASTVNSCAAMTVVFARGTTEPGNVGLLAGPEFFDALTDMLGAKNVDVVGVEYGATIEGFLQGGDKQGSALMASLVSSTLKSCPNTKLVMSGYSQGGQLVHNAAALLPSSTMAQVSSVVIFGDPLNGKPVVGASAGKTLIVCHKGDNICDGGDLILLEHLTYSQNAQQAATFAAARAGMGLGN